MNWWKKGFELNFRIRPVGLAIAAMYAIACWGAWRISLDQFYLPAGIRVAALLVCPPRLWPYLLLGEYAYFAQLRYPLIDQYGLAWVILGSAFLLPAVALVIHAHRRVMTATTDGWLLSVAVSAALVATALKLGLSHLLSDSPSSVPFATRAVRFVLGDYIAILTVAPLAVLWSRRHSMYEWRFWRSSPTIAALSLMLGLGLFTALAPGLSDSAKTSLQLAMALPVIILTCVHGWQGAAIGVPLLNILIALMTPTSGQLGSFDARTFMTQQLVAIAGTGLLALGARITQRYHQHADRDLDGHQAARLSRSAHMAGEMDLRERALDLRRIADGIEASLNRTADLLKMHGHHSPAMDLLLTSTAHSRQFRELTSMVYPTEVEQVGLYLALQVSGIRESWDQTHRVVPPHLAGDPCQLSIALQLAAYRTLCEAVALLLKHEHGQVQIRARCGRWQGQQGILVSVSLLDRNRPLLLDTTRLAVERLSSRALAYGGSVQCRGNRVRVLLLEPTTGATSGSTHAAWIARADIA
ncbi:MASE1 domain-containing protein [Stenotrophomonas sp. 24(2023)]|uniref:MASE1 domain-containing protein n=1 Tax=Stenotrophomonas sp. 24(2023) TaxID=3068324 RepID=UPI0027E098D7|nr:MASE1 domain-containing protein [Stenotrophomonas sp. 24(2023)]WMJ68563.1 MASE1 domain-containing protein [Stenotrophomonas sp. 24(2023)]